MKTGLRIALRSWKLPWQEKTLLIQPVLLFVALLAAQIFMSGLGIERYDWDIYQVNPGALAAEVEFDVDVRESFLSYLLISSLVNNFFYVFFSAAAVAIALRSLESQYLYLESGFAAAKQRLGQLFVLAFFLVVLDAALNYLLAFMRTDVKGLLLMVVNLFFVLLIPVIIAEGGEYWFSRCIYLYRKVLGTLIISSIALGLSMAVPGVAILALIQVTGESYLGLFLLVVFLWLALPVSWSYLALLYQHAVDRESADALPSNP